MFEFRELEVVHWDYWERFSLPMDAHIITVVGPNGSGKTTLLDALRTLLTIDCAGNRDFKSYLRHNGKPFAWLRAVVGNTPGPTGARPFFPIMDGQATLFCRIQKKGGEWTRQFAILAGSASIEDAEQRGDWVGLRDYRIRLEAAGLSGAIRRVLTLEQGATDKLCQLSPRALLDLVFDVFGDKATLDDYQRARNEQEEAEREGASLNHQLNLLGVSLQAAEGRARAYAEWQALKRERQDLMIDVLPRVELAEQLAVIRNARPQLGVQRRKARELLAERSELVHLIAECDEGELRLRAEQGAADEARQAAMKALERTRAAHTANSVVLQQRDRLNAQLETQDQVDVRALGEEGQALRAKAGALGSEEQSTHRELESLKSRLQAWRSGRRYVPEFESQFRAELDRAGIAHRMLSEIVEITDPTWQAAIEGVLAGYRHVVLLENPQDRETAWAIGERLRFKHFVVADRAPVGKASPGSLLDVVEFTALPPEWLPRQLERIQRVDEVKLGAHLPREQEWITPAGYYKERRGGRHLGVDDSYFGTAARERQLREGEARLAELETRLLELVDERRVLSQRINEIEAQLKGSQAGTQLAARAEEFAEAESQRELLEAAVLRAAETFAAAEAAFSEAQQRRQQNSRERDRLDGELKQEERQRSEAERNLLGARQEQLQRLLGFRRKRTAIPFEKRTIAALAELRETYESQQAVRREVDRLEARLREGHWETDDNVLGLRDKLADDHQALKTDLERRAAHAERARRSTDEARGAYLSVLRATLRQYARNLRHLAELAGIGVEVDLPEFGRDDLALAQSGLIVRFEFDKKGWIGMDDGEASGGQQVMKSLLLLVALMRDEHRPGGFVFIDEPFAHLDIFNIDKVSAFLKATRAQYVLTTPVTHNINVFQPSELTLVTSKRRPGSPWAQPVAVLRRASEGEAAA
jgi:chromosome segregation protein